MILMFVVVLISLPGVAQKQPGLFEQLTEKYADQDGFSASLLTRDMFKLYMRKKNMDESSEVAATLKNLDRILVVSQNNLAAGGWVTPLKPGNAGNAENLKTETGSGLTKQVHNEILQYYRNQGYILFKTEKKMGEDIKVYMKKNQEKITALALVTSSSYATNLVELQGSEIDLASVASLSKTLNLKGLESLYKIDNSNPFFYPGFTATIPEGLDEESLNRLREKELEWNLQFSDEQLKALQDKARLSEEQVRQIEERARIQAQKQAELSRQMAEMYGRKPVFLSTPGDTNIVYYLNGKKIGADGIKNLSPDKIKSVEVNKAQKEGEKSTIRIETK